MGLFKTLRYPSIWDIEDKILKVQEVGTCISLLHIHCIRDIDAWDIKDQLCLTSNGIQTEKNFKLLYNFKCEISNSITIQNHSKS